VNRTVLYIEDYVGAVRLVERLLEARRPDTELHVAMNAGEGIKIASDKQPALILLDDHLPDATGPRS
jgi:CheY-like chemotaxis protein